jgi:hypothetical protein
MKRGKVDAALSARRSVLPWCEQARLGPNHFARHDKTRVAMRLVRRIKDLGYDVEIKAAA